jgi:hypothetical protein
MTDVSEPDDMPRITSSAPPRRPGAGQGTASWDLLECHRPRAGSQPTRAKAWADAAGRSRTPRRPDQRAPQDTRVRLLRSPTALACRRRSPRPGRYGARSWRSPSTDTRRSRSTANQDAAIGRAEATARPPRGRSGASWGAAAVCRGREPAARRHPHPRPGICPTSASVPRAWRACGSRPQGLLTANEQG